jgi:hypothetical protein
MTDNEIRALLDAATLGPFSCQTFDVTGYVYGPRGNLIAEVYGALGGAAPANTRLFGAAPALANAALSARAEAAALRDALTAAEARVAELEGQVPSVCQREAATQFRHDDKVDKLKARNAELTAALDEAQALRADALQRAAAQGDPWIGPVTKNKTVDAQSIAAQQIKARILALADEPATAALERIRAEARTDERDRCALIAESGLWALPHYNPNTENDLADKVEEGYGNACVNIARLIRALTPAAKEGGGK